MINILNSFNLLTCSAAQPCFLILIFQKYKAVNATALLYFLDRASSYNSGS